MHQLIHRSALTLAALAASTSAVQAQTQPWAPAAGDDEATTVFVGVQTLRNHSRLADLRGAGVPSGLNLQVGDADTLALAIEQRSGPNWGVELALGYPPRVSSSAAGSGWSALGIQPGTTLVSASALSPTLFVNYHFGIGDSVLEPFVGLGINYTHFGKVDASPALNASALGATSVHLDDSWGMAGQAGLTYHIDRRLALQASVAMVRVRSNLTASSPQAVLGPTTATTRIDFRPQVYKLQLGYSF